MRLTRRGAAVAVLAVLLLVAGQWGGYPVLRALGAVLLGAVLTAVALTARGLRVGVRRSVYPDRVERGSPAVASLRVRNPGSARQPALLASDGLADAPQTVRVRPLRPGAEATYHYELPTGRRGKLTVGPLALHREDLFGLARNRLPTGEMSTLCVHPKRHPARAFAGRHPRHHHDGASTDDALRGSVDLRDVREYVPGDEVRHLHWKATASTGRLMVRDLADPEQPRFTALLDTRPGSLPAPAFEEAVDFVASLVTAAAVAGQHSRLITSSGVDVPTAGGTHAARILLDELAELAQSGDPDAAVVPGVLAARRGTGGCLVLVTSPTADLSSLSLLRNRFSATFVFAVGDLRRHAATVAGAKVLGAADAAQAVRRWNEVAA